MITTITDDFNLEKITSSGQCFRVRDFSDGTYRFITGSEILYIKEVAPTRYDISCTEREWQDTWHTYFDLKRDYRAVRHQIPDDDTYMSKAATEGAGIRILRQDPWEMLITFIISQRKSIPAIKKSVELLCSSYGRPLQTDRELLYIFPTADQLILASDSDLQACKLGYRTPYIEDAISSVFEKKIDLSAMKSYDDPSLFTALKSIKGVGDKVANCVSLFAYGRTSMVPVDTWISKIIDTQYGGTNPFPTYGSTAGILQQYAFFYAQNHKSEI